MGSQSFRNRLIVAFLFITIVPQLVTAALIAMHSYTTHIENTREHQQQEAESLAKLVDAFLQGAERELTTTIRLMGATNDPNQARPILERLLANRSEYREIALFGEDGRERLRLSNVRLVAAAPRDTGNLQEFERDGVARFSAIRFDADSGEPLMDLSIPVISPRHGRAVGLIVAELRVRAIWKLVSDWPLSEGEDIYVIDDDRRVIAHRNPSKALGGVRVDFLAGERWQTGLAGELVMAASAPVLVAQRHFTVVVESSFAAASRPALSALALVTLVTIVSLGVTLGLFAMAVRSVVRPLQAISAAAGAIRDGDYDRRVEIDNADEIGQLADAFNGMTARLQGVLGELNTEVDERRKAEAQMLKANKAYRALSKATTLLGRSSGEEQEILDAVCRIVIEDCGYRLVWIGFLEADAGRITPVAHAGFEEGYLQNLNISLADPLRGKGPSASCIRERRPIVVKDIHTDQSFIPWREDAHRRGYASVANVPLMADGRMLGMLAVYASEPGAFSDEELQLLGELASNLAHGLLSQRLQRERAQAVQALQDGEAKLREVTNAVPALVWMMTDKGVTYLNQRFYNYTGLDEAGSLGDGWQSCVHPDDLAPMLATWQTALAGGTPVEAEMRIRRHDREYRWFLAQGEPITSRSGEMTWFGTCIDIEDRKRGELQLIQASKLATLGEMAAGMAHELGQPLNIIRITADDTVLHLAEGHVPPEKIAKSLNLIAGQVVRMGRIIEHMRVFSRDDNLVEEVVELSSLVQDVADLIGPQMAANGIALRPKLPQHAIHVRGNGLQLEQVLLNLLTNARDAIESAAPSTLGIARGQIEITLAVRDEHVEIVVADDGPGIPAGAMEHIFEPFFTTKGSGQGTGLGLAVSRRIIDRMAGKLEPGTPATGASFRISLPLAEAPAAEPEATQPPAMRHAPQGARLLLVEDEVMAAELLAEILTRRGFTVTIAKDVPTALAAFAHQAFDIVISDVTMPGGDGVSLVRSFRAQRPNIPTVFVTGRIDAASLLPPELRTPDILVMRKPVASAILVQKAIELLGEKPEQSVLS